MQYSTCLVVRLVAGIINLSLLQHTKCATTEICFEANNPGVWPLHCHMSCKVAPLMSLHVPNVCRRQCTVCCSEHSIITVMHASYSQTIVVPA
jgi:hypothetical protein